MKYINLTLENIELKFKNFPKKNVKPGATVILSEHKYSNLLDKNVEALGLKLVNNKTLPKIFQSKQYKELDEKIKAKTVKKEKKKNKDK